MCTLALYFQEFEDYPLIIAANRDEFYTRPSAPPRVLASNPVVIGGKDLLAGGTWLGINEHGLLAGILNRRSNTGKERVAERSRGSLCLNILSVKSPLEGCELLKNQQGSLYQPFNLLFANAEHAYVAYNQGEEIPCIRLEKGLHVLSNTSVYDARSEKMNRAYLLFSRVRDRLQRESDYLSRVRSLKAALSDHTLTKMSGGPKDSICVHTESYGTVSSSIIFYARAENRFTTFYAPGAPCRNEYGKSLGIEAL
ncbi:MAG: NRDE family protein [Candidatus Binatia bacterium]